MNLVTRVVGGFSTNCYMLAADGSPDCVVIDPGAEGEKVVEDAARAGLRVRYVIVTHGHADHTGAVATVVDATGAPFAAHPGDADEIASARPWITDRLPDFVPPPAVDRFLEDGDILIFGSASLEVIATPGHTPGSVCFRCEGMLFSGDTLFRASIGRYDLPGGDGKQELHSIRERLLALPDETVVLPGHGPRTTIRDERTRNPFLTGRISL